MSRCIYFLLPIGLAVFQITLLLFYFKLDTPKHYTFEDDESNAMHSLNRIYSSERATEEFHTLVESKDLAKFKNLTYMNLFSPTYRWALLVCAVFIVLRNVSGMIMINSFSLKIYEGELEYSIMTYILMILFLLICFFTIDRIGRRLLILIGSFGAFVSGSAAMCIAFMDPYNENGPTYKIPLFITSVLCLISYAASTGPLGFILPTELLPDKGTAVVQAIYWIEATCYIIGIFLIFGKEDFKKGKIFILLMFAFFLAEALLLFIWTLHFIKETLGKTEHEIMKDYTQEVPAKNSLLTRSMVDENESVDI